jgi:multidrug efflux pump subunit AcrA (membrane-fusion protein)
MIWALVAVVALIVVWRVIAFVNRDKDLAEDTTPVVLASPARVTPYEESLVFYGTLEPRDQVMVFPDAPGKVISFAVREGTAVGKGTTIATVDRAIAGLDYKPLVVASPAYGVVAEVLVDPGMQVAPSTPMAKIYRTKDLILPLDVGEKDFPKIEVGQKVKITFATFPDEVFEGEVKRIFPALDPLSHMVRAEVTINDAERELRAGMFARADISVGYREEVLFVPREAVSREGEETFVWGLDGGKLARRPVCVGAVCGDAVEIKEGLKEGDLVVVRGGEGLGDGVAVHVEERGWAE